MDLPEILYHYTDANGLDGIIKSKEIWATSYRFMSDAREFEYGFDLISDIYPREQPPVGLLHLGEYEIKDSGYAGIIKAQKWRYDYDCIFVASFSADGDLLSQWRGYAGLHSGYSIGFHSDSMKSIDTETQLIGCCYDKDQQLAEIKGIIDCYLARMKTEKDIADSLPLSTEAAFEVAIRSTKYKHHAFREEKEWRLVVGPLVPESDRICYRVGERVIIPYVKIGFPAGLPIERIIVGPGPHQERNAWSLRQMLKLQGLEKVEVSLSEAPFRTW